VRYAEGRPVKEVAAEMTALRPEELERLLDPRAMTEGGIFKQGWRVRLKADITARFLGQPFGLTALGEFF
jgi:hypothetical protein